MIFRHKYLDLGLGLVKENYTVCKLSDIPLWESRGFSRIRKYPIFRYSPKPSEAIMLSRPQNVSEFGTEKLIGCPVYDMSPYLGTYGMGGPGFFGIGFDCGGVKMRLVFCIWSAAEHMLLDDRVIQCYPDFAEKYRPWTDPYDQAGSLERLKDSVFGNAIIRDIKLSAHSFGLTLEKDGEKHILFTEKYSERFPEQGGTGKKRNSYDKGEMKDCWLVIYDGTELCV